MLLFTPRFVAHPLLYGLIAGRGAIIFNNSTVRYNYYQSVTSLRGRKCPAWPLFSDNYFVHLFVRLLYAIRCFSPYFCTIVLLLDAWVE